MIEFQCLVTDDYRGRIDAVASELNARVDYFRGFMNVLAIIRDDEYLGCVWVLGKDLEQLRRAVLEVLNAN